MNRSLRSAFAVASLACAAAICREEACAAPTILISWDGAPDWVFDKMLAEGKLPNVARLAKEGVRAHGAQPALPSLTAPGHAALWTGCYGDVNGIVGNDVPLLPRSEHTLLERRSGYAPASLLAEPLWITAAREGKRVLILSATHSEVGEDSPGSKDADADALSRLTVFSGFGSSIGRSVTYTGKEFKPATGWSGLPVNDPNARDFTATIGTTPFHFLEYDDPADPIVGFDTVLIRPGSKGPDAVRSAQVKPSAANETVEGFVGPFRADSDKGWGSAWFRLWDLKPDGSLVLYQRAVNVNQSTAPTAEADGYRTASGGFYDSSFFGQYKPGKMGKQLWKGGDGEAEKRLIETVRLDCQILTNGTRDALKRWDSDLIFTYAPMSDSAGHVWMGMLDPEMSGYDAALAQKLWPYYEQVFALQDEWLGALMDAAGPDATIGLFSDHGMVGVRAKFHPNAVLRDAGLLETGAKGAFKLDHTQIAATSWNPMALWVNGTDWREGIVQPADRESVIAKAANALLSAIDPATGDHFVKGVFRPEDSVTYGTGGPLGADLYLDLAPGYYADTAATSGSMTMLGTPPGYGDHGFPPLRRKMQAIFFLKGPAFREGVLIPPVRQIDLVPTICAAMGIAPPATATGHVLGDALKPH
ncbi:alkaline phosphatase family protein [soil metagenome]